MSKTRSLAEQERAIREQVDCLQRSYRELDGKVRDPDRLYDISCLKAAARTIRNVRSQIRDAEGVVVGRRR